MREARTVMEATPTPSQGRRSVRSILASLEIDGRLLGMIVAMGVVWIVFHFLSHGLFLSPRNLWNLSVQSAAVAIMTTGMVLIIVSRNIDLSIGSVLAVVALVMALLQTDWIPNGLGVGLNQPYTWIVVVVIGIALGALIGAFHGFLIAYFGIPSFIVTLGGLLAWRGVSFGLVSGRTIGPLDSTFQRLGGGSRGSLGANLSWLVAGLAIAAIVYGIVASRRRRRQYGFPLRAAWADMALGVIGSVVVGGAVWIANSYPPGTPYGIAIPVLIALAIAVVMTWLATRRRFGRYVYSIGGNPEAAELAGINTRMTIMKTFILMGILCAATNGLGTGVELQVIAAAVIGGTSFAGGIGTIAGGVLGAVVMQSLSSGMVLMGVPTALQDIVVAGVLVTAVGVDSYLRRGKS
jgi:D-xylose transport system permease protein